VGATRTAAPSVEHVLRSVGWLDFEIGTHRATRAAPPLEVSNTEAHPRTEYRSKPPSPPGKTLADLLDQRRSHRSFSARAMSVAELCTVVAPAFTSPAGRPSCAVPGAIRTISALAIVNNMVDNDRAPVPPGLYEICPEPFALTTIRALPFSEAAASVDTADISQPAAILLLCLRARSPRRYLNAYELSLLEAGQILQNIALTATSAEIGSCVLGSVFDEPLLSITASGVHPQEAARRHGVPIAAVAIGHIPNDSKTI